MVRVLAAFVIAMGATSTLTPVFRSWALRRGLIDPVGDPRKIHAGRIPRIGGAAMAVAICLTLALLSAAGVPWAGEGVHSILIAAGAIVMLGVYDDVRGADALLKLIVQVGIAVGLVVDGFRVEQLTLPMLGTFSLGAAAAPLSVVWIVAVTNAVNLIDGLDGLAAGIALVALAVVAALFHAAARPELALVGALAGATAGFLFYNAPPASVFMGDTGSLLLGLLLAIFSMQVASLPSVTPAGTSVVVALALLAVPLFDTSFAIVRRLSRGVSPFKGDRSHLHHQLLDLGFSRRCAAVALIATAALASCGALFAGTTFGLVAAALAMCALLAIPMVHAATSVQRGRVAIVNEAAAAAARALADAPGDEHIWLAVVGFADAVGATGCKLSLARPGEDSTTYRWRRAAASSVEERGALWSVAGGHQRIALALAWADPSQRRGKSGSLRNLVDQIDRAIERVDASERQLAVSGNSGRIRRASGAFPSEIK